MRITFRGARPTCLSILLLTSIFFGVTLTSVGGQSSTPHLYVDPSQTESWIPAYGETFITNVSIADVSDLQSFEFKLYWNTTLLDLAGIELKQFLKPLWVPVKNEINETLGRYLLNITSTASPPGASGSGALVTLTFKITCEPIWPQNVTGALDLADTKLVDSNGAFIPHTVSDGQYVGYSTQLLSLTTLTEQPLYVVNETMHVYGNLTLDSSPVQDGNVALEVDNPLGDVIVIRTLSIGNPPADGTVEIIDVIPSGGPPNYNPRSWFYRGTSAFFNITVRNNGNESRRVLTPGNIHDATLTPVGYGALVNTISAGVTLWGIFEFSIPTTAAVGNAHIYASALTGWPRNGGTPYCPERNATFEIRDIGGAGSAAGLPQISGSSPQAYNLTFRLPADSLTGIYRASASAAHQEHSALTKTAFGISAVLVPDHYPTIQAAVNAATPTNNSILVMPGTHTEQVIVDTSLALVARDPRAGRTTIKGNGVGTVVTIAAASVTVTGFTIRNSGSLFPDSGIALEGFSGCTVRENTLANNYFGIRVQSSENHTIFDNKLLCNTYGVHLNSSTGNTIGRNYIICNKYNLGILGETISDFTHTIEASNTANAKPVIYWMNRNGGEVPSDAGFVAIVNSTNINVRALDLTENVQGILFAFTNSSVIERVDAVRNEYGIYLYNSHYNLIVGCTVSNNVVGIYQRNSDASNIYHNNFVENTDQADHQQSSNTWNDGAGKGNHWSDYAGVDDGSGGRIAGDGVGDTLLPHQNVDWYPLMTPWSIVHDVAVTNVIYAVVPYNSSNVFPKPPWKVRVIATVENEGDSIETFNLSAHANTTFIETQTVTLPVRGSTTINLTWSLSESTPVGNYTLSATATQVPGETDTADNTYIDGTIQLISEPNPDINGDGIVDIIDIVIVALAFGSRPGYPDWNPVADLNGDLVVDIIDIVLVALHFGKTWPP